METKYDGNNRGALWRNETATEENRQPFMSGTCEVNGKKMVVAAWKTDAKGDKKARLDLKFQEPKAKEVSAVDNDNTSTTADMDIPF